MVRKRKFSVLAIILIFISVLSLTGCTTLDDVEVSLGMKNKDFEFIKQGKIDKITIQNTRDRGFAFVVTDTRTIQELYDILSSAKPVKEKSSLDPDYVFEMQLGSDKVYKFNYIAGLDKKDAGNLYSSDHVYIVSKRIDTDIINNFWNIRTPKDFNKVYYNSILEVLDRYKKDTGNDKSIGVNLNNDLEVAKFILSTDLEDFKGSLAGEVKNSGLIVKNDKESHNIEADVVTQGYKSDLYKAVVTFTDKADNSVKKYYIDDKYKDVSWDIGIYTDSNKPSDF